MRILVSSWLLGALLLGCSEPPERPPFREGCENGCGVFRPTGLNIGGGGEGGAGEAPQDEEVILSGEVAVMADDGFQILTGFSGEVRLFAEGESGRQIEAETQGSRYAFRGLRRGQSTWIHLVPDAPELMGMIVAVDTRERLAGILLPVVDRGVLDEMVLTLSSQVLIDGERGQVVLGFIDQQRLGVAGVAVESAAASVIAYATSGRWSDIDLTTESRGLVALLNVPATTFGSSSVSVSLVGAASGSLSLPVARDTLTFGRYQLDGP